MIHAKPNLNGNSVEDFERLGTEVYEAAIALKTALTNARAEVFHGRNYQSVPSDIGFDPRGLDLTKLDHLLTSSIQAEQLGIEIFRKGESE